MQCGISKTEFHIKKSYYVETSSTLSEIYLPNICFINKLTIILITFITHITLHYLVKFTGVRG